MPLTIWNPIKVYKALRWDAALNAEEYLRANLSLTLLSLMFSVFSIPLFMLSGLSLNLSDTADFEIFSFFTSIHLEKALPETLLILCPVMAVFAFVAIYQIKLDVMRLHAFSFSGWWVLPISLIFILFSYFKILLLNDIFYSFISYFSNFSMMELKTKWENKRIFEHAPKKFEWFMVMMSRVFLWYWILGGPIFTLIKMM